jgi:hypothetical protein
MQSMRPFVLSTIAVGFVVITLSAQTSPEQDEQKIRTVVAEYMAARNENSPDAVRKLFTPDADQLVSTGEWRKGLNGSGPRHFRSVPGRKQARARSRLKLFVWWIRMSPSWMAAIGLLG